MVLSGETACRTSLRGRVHPRDPYQKLGKEQLRKIPLSSTADIPYRFRVAFALAQGSSGGGAGAGVCVCCRLVVASDSRGIALDPT